ncbi:hypothetical protein YOLOSWAG_64 [Erwinia phage vB_EamM_Yoloswag]|uniref:Uncharacterized protein n=1 Tax=Erwinia phage vB_EamM_Yoloswag TaxID=1958956 RepID=A0A1S6L2Y9_9CAUD|nr:hypothetical protein HOR66_gp064 [Erwinia phage vB_EamM_Yoloswag]AQT28547.1 hypothetical protein YOLOSWAG_64 [Erwinia phage vB_EamM_Yoloswag]
MATKQLQSVAKQETAVRGPVMAQTASAVPNARIAERLNSLRNEVGYAMSRLEHMLFCVGAVQSTEFSDKRNAPQAGEVGKITEGPVLYESVTMMDTELNAVRSRLEICVFGEDADCEDDADCVEDVGSKQVRPTACRTSFGDTMWKLTQNVSRSAYGINGLLTRISESVVERTTDEHSAVGVESGEEPQSVIEFVEQLERTVEALVVRFSHLNNRMESTF